MIGLSNQMVPFTEMSSLEEEQDFLGEGGGRRKQRISFYI